MAKDLLRTLKMAEANWRESSPEWNRKLEDWERWKLQAKDRERLADRARKQKNDDAPGDVATQGGSWEASFNPDDPLPQFSFMPVKNAYSMTDLDADIAQLSWNTKIPSWAFECLRRGIAVHHAGMNFHYRNLVERQACLCFPKCPLINAQISACSDKDACEWSLQRASQIQYFNPLHNLCRHRHVGIGDQRAY